MFLIIEETILDFSQGTVKVLQIYFIQYKTRQQNTLNVKLSSSQLDKLK